MNYILLSLLAGFLLAILVFLYLVLMNQTKLSNRILNQNQTLVNQLVSRDLQTFISLQAQTQPLSEQEKSLEISHSDEAERKRFDKTFANITGLGEPIYPEGEVDGYVATMQELLGDSSGNSS